MIKQRSSLKRYAVLLYMSNDSNELNKLKGDMQLIVVLHLSTMLLTFANVFFLLLQQQQKFVDCKKRCVKAKNDYVLSLESTNRFLKNYYSDFLGTLVNVSIKKINT